MVQAPDWQETETILFEKSKEAIERFAKEHPDVQCSFFAYFANPLSGEFAVCFDTPENALQQAKKEELRIRARREKLLHSPPDWRVAQATLGPHLTDYTPIVDHFQYAFYTWINFGNWTEFFDSENYPEQLPELDDYLAGNARIILWRVLERLIQEQVFSLLNITPLFRLGYHFYEETLVVLRILNWPNLLANGEEFSPQSTRNFITQKLLPLE